MIPLKRNQNMRQIVFEPLKISSIFEHQVALIMIVGYPVFDSSNSLTVRKL